MMSTTHTPGPWQIDKILDAIIFDGKGISIGNMYKDVDAKRVVECVNAMEGIDNPKEFRNNWEAIKHLELDKYHNLKEVIENMIDRLDEGGEMTLTKDSIIVHALREAIK